MKTLVKFLLFLFYFLNICSSYAQEDVLKFEVGMFQPDKDKNDNLPATSKLFICQIKQKN